MEKEKKLQKIALLVSCASVLQAAEFLMPSPIPGVKLGLANIITLIVLADMGFVPALEVAILRTVVSSLFLGTFLSPTFIMSLAGAVTSTLVMGLTFRLLGFISTSVIGSVTHVVTQVFVVYFLVIRHPGVFVLIPWLGASAVIMGWATGAIAMNVCLKLKDRSITDKLPLAENTRIIPGNASYSRSSMLKLLSTGTVCLLVLLVSDLRLYGLVFILLLAAAVVMSASFLKLFAGVKRLKMFLFFSLLIPLFFNNSGNELFSFYFLKATYGGLFTGAVFASRLILLIMATSLLSITTPAEELAGTLRKFIGDRLSRVIMISWENIPVLWERSRLYIRKHKFDRTIFRKALPIAINLVALLYAETEQVR